MVWYLNKTTSIDQHHQMQKKGAKYVNKFDGNSQT